MLKVQIWQITSDWTHSAFTQLLCGLDDHTHTQTSEFLAYLSVCWRRWCSVCWLVCVSVSAQQREAGFYRLISAPADDIIAANLAKRQELNGAKHLVPDAPLLTPIIKTWCHFCVQTSLCVFVFVVIGDRCSVLVKIYAFVSLSGSQLKLHLWPHLKCSAKGSDH